MPDLTRAVNELRGSRIVELRRTLNIAIVGFERDATEIRLHAQCPFRAVRGDQILIGSTDMLYPQNRGADPDAAYKTYTTMYDRNAARLTARFAADQHLVLAAELTETGAFFLDATDSIRFEIIPACSGPIEAWRLFELGSDEHHVYPNSADR